MHLESRTELPDHDFVIAEKRKLIPSIYGALVFKNQQLSYSGPTYIAVTSGKHDHSTAITHLSDLLKCLFFNEFKEYSRGPHKNPRFPKAQQCYSDLFIQNNLDALFVAINAPGHSAYNQVEHCMAPLSHD
ncbi:unnamed protein product [Adineta steineri]|uniref:Uncharacterized protein n=1 Tax=Adineta steineri TaxID=433720 RepID=A0A815T494_9BILA|nr:unnamed protein product [Adineta steineri]CAF4139350.1 unnamed protein product [Adineta steineri]